MLSLYSLVTDLIFLPSAALDQQTLIDALGGVEAAKQKKLLDPDDQWGGSRVAEVSPLTREAGPVLTPDFAAPELPLSDGGSRALPAETGSPDMPTARSARLPAASAIATASAMPDMPSRSQRARLHSPGIFRSWFMTSSRVGKAGLGVGKTDAS